MSGEMVEKEKLDLVLDLYARAAHILELQKPFLMLLLHLVNTYKLKDNINPEQIETMWTVIQQQVNGAKQLMLMEGKPYPPESL